MKFMLMKKNKVPDWLKDKEFIGKNSQVSANGCILFCINHDENKGCRYNDCECDYNEYYESD